MMASFDCYAIIKHYESLRLQSYLDPKGLPTIGFGHVIDMDDHPMIIGREDAIRLLENDVHYAETQVSKMITREPIPQHHFDAIVSWAFNIGCGRAAKSTLIRFYNFGQDRETSNEFLRWNRVKVSGKSIPFKGLTNRRVTERQLFLLGTFQL